MPAGIYVRKPLEQRFWDKVNKNGPIHPIHGQCWVWHKTKSNKSSYGQTSLNKKRIYPHRLSWELHFGPIPKDLVICHQCDNGLCVNPAHLFLGTHQDNVKDKMQKGRQSKGEDGPAKLTEEDILEIRRLYQTGNFTHQIIADSISISRSQITRIVNKKNWSHI